MAQGPGRTGGDVRGGRRWAAFLLAASTGLTVLAVPPAAAAAAAPAAVLQGAARERVIVVLSTDRMSAAGTASTVRALSAEYGMRRRQSYTRLFTGFAASMPAAQVAALRRDPAVASVHVDTPIRATGEVPPGCSGCARTRWPAAGSAPERPSTPTSRSSTPA